MAEIDSAALWKQLTERWGVPATFAPSMFKNIAPIVNTVGGGDSGPTDSISPPDWKYVGPGFHNDWSNFAFTDMPYDQAMKDYYTQHTTGGGDSGASTDWSQWDPSQHSTTPQEVWVKSGEHEASVFKLVPDASGKLVPTFDRKEDWRTNPDNSMLAKFLAGAAAVGGAAYAMPSLGGGDLSGLAVDMGGGGGGLAPATFNAAQDSQLAWSAMGAGGAEGAAAAAAATPNVLATGANSGGVSSWFSGLADAARGAGSFLRDNKELIGAGAALAGLAGAATSGAPSTSGRLDGVANDELAFQKQQWERLAPIYEQLLQDSLKGSQEDRARANEAWQFYTDTFKPVQARYAQDVMAYDSPDEIARREALAAGTAQSQIDSQRQQATREMARIGLSPERVGQQLIDDANAAALAKASAINAERNNTKLTGIGLRQTAAGFGNTIPQQGLAAAGSSRADQATAIGNINSQVGNRSVGVNTALNPLIAANNASTAAYNSRQGMWGNLVGAGLNLLISDERKKENIQPVDEEAALAGLEAIPVSKFDYKPGAGDGGTHIGPMAQDVRAQFGDRVAPGGVGIDPVTMNGVTIAAVKGLAKKVARLERRLGADGGGAREVDSGDLPSLSMIGLEAL